MSSSFDEISDFVRAKTGTKKSVTPNTAIVEDLGCVGDDFFELLEDYSQRFHVDMASFLWYFHTPDEASFSNVGALLFKPPYKRVERLPVTAGMLKEFADKGRWDISYPKHTLPKRRYDVYLTWAIVGPVILLSLVPLIWKLAHLF